ncbi:MAG: CHAD domain-containing protein, partial [Candidatus Eiseniibacteriota bacterium]
LRTALEVLADGYPEALIAELADDLRWIVRALGRVRDLDVAIEHVERLEAEATSHERPALQVFAQGLAVRRAERRLGLVERLDSERFGAFAARARAWADANPPAASSVPHGTVPGFAVAQGIVSKWMDVMRDAYARAEESMEPDDLHALRIAAKKARYAVEYFADIEGHGSGRRAKRIATLQDFLGDQRDAISLWERMRRYARTVPKKDHELVLGAGSVLGHLERAARIRRHDLHLAWERAVGE